MPITLGSTEAANIVLLGALLEETDCLAPETALSLIETRLKKVELLEINCEALAAGKNFIGKQVQVGPVAQPDALHISICVARASPPAFKNTVPEYS